MGMDRLRPKPWRVVSGGIFYSWPGQQLARERATFWPKIRTYGRCEQGSAIPISLLGKQGLHLLAAYFAQGAFGRRGVIVMVTTSHELHIARSGRAFTVVIDTLLLPWIALCEAMSRVGTIARASVILRYAEGSVCERAGIIRLRPGSLAAAGGPSARGPGALANRACALGPDSHRTILQRQLSEVVAHVPGRRWSHR